MSHNQLAFAVLDTLHDEMLVQDVVAAELGETVASASEDDATFPTPAILADPATYRLRARDGTGHISAGWAPPVVREPLTVAELRARDSTRAAIARALNGRAPSRLFRRVTAMGQPTLRLHFRTTAAALSDSGDLWLATTRGKDNGSTTLLDHIWNPSRSGSRSTFRVYGSAIALSTQHGVLLVLASSKTGALTAGESVSVTAYSLKELNRGTDGVVQDRPRQ